MKTRIRQLIDGCYVAEVKKLFGWYGIWESSIPESRHCITERQGSAYYDYCVKKTKEEADLIRRKYMANHGVGMMED